MTIYFVKCHKNESTGVMYSDHVGQFIASTHLVIISVSNLNNCVLVGNNVGNSSCRKQTWYCSSRMLGNKVGKTFHRKSQYCGPFYTALITIQISHITKYSKWRIDYGRWIAAALIQKGEFLPNPIAKLSSHFSY